MVCARHGASRREREGDRFRKEGDQSRRRSMVLRWFLFGLWGFVFFACRGDVEFAVCRGALAEELIEGVP